MKSGRNLSLTAVCAPSGDVVAREIEGDIVIVPLVAGIGDADDELYSLNPTGRAIWRKLDGRRRMNICSAFGEGRILKYNLILKGDTDPRVLKAYPDLTRFTYFLMPADRIPRNRKVILDIDLDYFACRDSIHNQFSYQLEVTGDQFAAADSFLRDPTIRFSGLEFKFREKDGRYFTEVSPRKGKDISYLPPKEDLVAEIRSLVSTLSARKVRPAVVTVSRSCVSGYCPPEYAAFIEDELKNALKELVPATDAGAAPPAPENVPAGQNINK